MSDTCNDYKEENHKCECKEVKCTVCGTLTKMTGTQLCDGCWELKAFVDRLSHQSDERLGYVKQAINKIIVRRTL